MSNCAPDTTSKNHRILPAGVIAGGYLMLVGCLLGLSVIMAKLAIINGAEPVPFLVLAMFGAGGILLLVEALRGHKLILNRRTLEYGFISGLLFALPNALGFSAVNHVGAGFVSLTFAFPIILTYILALFVGLESFRRGRALGAVCGLAGGAILAISKVALGDSDLFWVVLSMISPVIIAVGNIYRTLRWPTGVSPLLLAAIMLLGGSIVLLPYVLVSGPAAFLDIAINETTLWLLAVQIAIFSILYVAYFVLQKLAGPVYLSQIGSVAAVSGAAMAVGLLNETMPPNLWLAGIFIAAAMILFQRTR